MALANGGIVTILVQDGPKVVDPNEVIDISALGFGVMPGNSPKVRKAVVWL